MEPSDSDNRQTVRAALRHAEAQAQRRRKVTRWVFVVVGATVLMSCLFVLAAVR